MISAAIAGAATLLVRDVGSLVRALADAELDVLFERQWLPTTVSLVNKVVLFEARQALKPGVATPDSKRLGVGLFLTAVMLHLSCNVYYVPTFESDPEGSREGHPNPRKHDKPNKETPPTAASEEARKSPGPIATLGMYPDMVALQPTAPSAPPSLEKQQQ
jgi:hypothetical protein